LITAIGLMMHVIDVVWHAEKISVRFGKAILLAVFKGEKKNIEFSDFMFASSSLPGIFDCFIVC